MKLPKEAKKLLQLEAKNLIELRRRLRMYMQGAVAGGALQVFQMRKQLEEYLAKDFLETKIATRNERVAMIAKELSQYIAVQPYTQTDLLSSNIAASSFSNAWAASQMSNVPFPWDSRLRKIVATETARSFSEVTGELSEQLKMSRVWVSILDAKTCRRCRAMDGAETQPGETFEGGLEPGFVHPYCRCYSVLILV